MKIKVKSTSKFVGMFAVCALFMVYLALPASAMYEEGKATDIPEGQMQIMSVSEPIENLQDIPLVEDSSKMAESGVVIDDLKRGGEELPEGAVAKNGENVPEGAVAKGDEVKTTAVPTSATVEEKSDNSTVITISIAAVGVVLIGGYFVFRSRKSAK